MVKKFNISLWVAALLIIMAAFNTFAEYKPMVYNASDEDSEVHLIIEAANDQVIPKHFRKSSDPVKTNDNTPVNLTGLDTLNISGSHQFSAEGLKLIKEAVGSQHQIIDIDLRQESHGFINGNGVSWANKYNNGNKGKTKEQVLEDEKQKLKGIPLDKPISFFNHPKIVLTPTKIQNENQLVKEQGIGYLRIPVTDGNIPADDMVDLFVDYVRTQKPKIWLHFHCKEGIGRTTTFMIMYDMMKNAKNVPAEDIIRRQVILANLSPSSVQSFYSKVRIDFLNEFYKYCVNNTDGYKTKWSKNRSTDSLGFIKNTRKPNSLLVISQDTLTPGERTMIATLQGLIADKSDTQIYTTTKSQPDYQIWLDDLQSKHGIYYKVVNDPWELLSFYKPFVAGYVLYDNTTKSDPSINNACSLAALENGIAIEASLEEKVMALGINKKIADCRNTDAHWAFNTLWDAGLKHSMVIHLPPDKDTALRDYGILTKSLVFYEDSKTDTSLRNKVFAAMDKNALCLGWGPDEYSNISVASKYGVSVVPADYSFNLSVLSAFPTHPTNQKSSQDPPKEENVHYVTFIMSDGDNQQWYLGSNFDSPKWFGSPDRGKFNLGWTISPSMYYLTPTVFTLYYQAAKQGKFRDYFMVSPSGKGYMFPSKFPKSDLAKNVQELNTYMKQVDQKYIAVLDDWAFPNKALWSKYTEQPNVEGIFYLNFSRQDDYDGKILWSNGKPVVACRNLLWAKLEEEDSLVHKINQRVADGDTKVQDASAYTVVYVHVWSKTTENVESVVAKLKHNPRIRVVAPDAFMNLVKRNIVVK